MKAGVHVDFAHVRFGFHNAAAARRTVAMCRKYRIRVIADEATMFDTVDEAFVGIPAPTHFQTDPPLPALAAVTDLVATMGGWPEVQTALRAVQRVAEKHGVTMRSVALRWVMDQGATPVVLTSWTHAGGCFGKAQLDKGAARGRGAVPARELLGRRGLGGARRGGQVIGLPADGMHSAHRAAWRRMRAEFGHTVGIVTT